MIINHWVVDGTLERKVSNDPPFNLAELLIHNAPPEVVEDADDLAMRIIYLTFGGLYPPSVLVSLPPLAVYLSQTLFEMAQMSTEDIGSVREEVKTVLEQEGGWTKMALDRFVKIDSILREVGRIHGVACFAMGRITVAAGTLLDGVVIPPGYQVVVNLKHFHRDARVYPSPYAFDPFRFSRLRETEDSGMKYGFTTVDDHFLSFGAGRHACPGRFFASMQLKIIIAITLLDYEVKLPDGKLTRPEGLIFDGLVVPPLTQHLLFKPRLGKKDNVLVRYAASILIKPYRVKA
ncbi:hypothetical protein CCMSSC00406_0009098 [Pleurotus cornucopiae]|uniref:Uncharacterized protein n=1 Tax=Pleurotus cornucopiae TaxID=5321 RepID=A0ACB7J7H0_PLECO|nr:hypothetical protein CCMSSC00406_0009098 [Pleurotus cornucopiae]